jgi:lipopolysaccharide/colanic/teichoic acid biosynthesis glycosyltransferase
MVELRVQGEDAAGGERAASRHNRRVPAAWPWLLPLVALAAALLLPLLYAELFYGRLVELPIDYMAHVGLNVVCNLVVLTLAWHLGGRLRSRVAWVLVVALLVHGLLLFGIVLGRLYFSRPMIFTAALVSIMGGLALVGVRNLVQRPRIGVIAPESQEALGWIPGDYEVIRDPAADLRAYDIVLVDFDDERHRGWMRAISSAMLAGRDVRHLAEYVEERRGRVSIDHFHVDHVNDPAQTLYRSAKRALDIVLVVASLPLALPLVGLGALSIALTMGRPVFFTQRRVGHAGRVFTIWKLRTMARTGDRGAVDATASGDARVTGVGRVLRRFRIDELPQFWNVLTGDMSFIGPRPEQPELAAAYAEQMPAFECRHLVRPGMTGWAQVRAGYAATLSETREKLSYDLYYLKNASVTLDLEIVARTLFTLISGRGVR